MRNSDNIAPEKVRDVLITRTAIKVLQAESVVEKVINFQFKDICEMAKVHHQIEVSGFGKFMISGPKVNRKVIEIELINSRIQNLLNIQELDEKKKALYEKRIHDNNVVLEYLKTRKNGYEN